MNARNCFDLSSISFKITQVILGVFLQLITTNIAFPQESNKLQTLIDGHMLVRGSNSLNSAKEFGKNILLKTRKFIKDPENKDLLNSPKGQELLKHQSYLHNYFTIKSHFEKCIKDQDNRRNLPARILDIAGNMHHLDLSCNPDILKEIPIENLHREIKRVVSLEMKSLFQDDLYLESMQNSLKSYISLRYRYESDFMKKRNESTIKKTAADIFKAMCSKKYKKVCPSYAGKALMPVIIKELKKAAGTPKQSYVSAAGNINNKLARMNKKLEQIPLVTEGGYFKTPVWDTSDADFKNKETQKKFNDYIETYLREASSGDGLLLHTDHIKDEAGKLRRLEDKDLAEDTNYFSPTMFTFEKHTTITHKDAEEAKEEAQKQMEKQMRMLSKMAKTKKRSERGRKKTGSYGWMAQEKRRIRDIRKLVKTNPAAVGTLLMKKPQYIGTVCDAINSISAKDVSDENWDKAFIWGGVVVGGALTVTGIGAGVGAFLLSGTASAVALGTAATVSSVTATALGVGELGYWGTRSYQHYDDMKNFEQAYITGNSDLQSINEAKESLDNYKRSLFHAALALGLSLRGLKGIKLVSNAGSKIGKFASRASWVIGKKQLASLTLILDTVANSYVAKTFTKVLKYLGPTGKGKLAIFFSYLSGTSADLRDRFLDQVKSKELEPQKIVEIVNETLNSAQDCEFTHSCIKFSTTLKNNLVAKN